MNSEQLTVVHNAEERRFEIELGDDLAVVKYLPAGDNIVYTHTEVPEAYEGQGIANKLAYAAMEYAKENNLTVQPLCPFIKLYVSKHPEYHAITFGFKKPRIV